MFESITVGGEMPERTCQLEIEVNEDDETNDKRVYHIVVPEGSNERTDHPWVSVEVQGAKLVSVVLTSLGTDETDKICDEMEKKVSECAVLDLDEKDNRGVAGAQQCGILEKISNYYDFYDY